MRYALTAVILLLSSCTYATEITWQAPTERENGAILYLHEIDYYTVTMSCGVNEYLFAESATSFTVPKEVKGVCDVKLTTIDTSGLESVYSEVFSVNVNSRPKPPFNITFTEK